MREHPDQIFGYGTLRSLHLWIRVSRQKRFRTRDLYSQQSSLETDFHKKWGNIPTKSLVTGPCVHSIYEYESQDKSVLEQETCIHNKEVSRQIFRRNEEHPDQIFGYGTLRSLHLWIRVSRQKRFRTRDLYSQQSSLKTDFHKKWGNIPTKSLVTGPCVHSIYEYESQDKSVLEQETCIHNKEVSRQIFRRNEGTSRPNLWLRDLAFTPFMNTSLKTKAF